MKKPTVHFNSRTESGNIYYILALVRHEMQLQRRILDYNALRDRVTASGSYAEALALIREVVDLVDLAGAY